jgi:hypothetical protein
MVIVKGEIGICLKGEVGQFSSLLLGTVQVSHSSAPFITLISSHGRPCSAGVELAYSLHSLVLTHSSLLLYPLTVGLVQQELN